MFIRERAWRTLWACVWALAEHGPRTWRPWSRLDCRRSLFLWLILLRRRRLQFVVLPGEFLSPSKKLVIGLALLVLGELRPRLQSGVEPQS